MQTEICQKKVQKNLNKSLKIKILDSVFSTNDYAKDKDFDVVISKMQTAGKGTKNRSFFSPEGGIYLSIKLNKPNVNCEELSLITPMTAVAVIEAVKKTCGINPQIKWVNDIYIKGKKVAGILSESVINGNEVDSVVVGIGVNVKRQIFPNFNLNTPTSIEEHTSYNVDKNAIIIEMLNSFYYYLENVSKKQFLEKYRENFYLIDKKVKIKSVDEEYQGTVLGVDDNFNLLLDVGNEVKKFNCADTVREI